jgi:shikimate kinase
MTNFVLIGMPGSGKSGLGRAAATTLGLYFVDLDEEIERRTDRSPSAIITEDGEAAFRKIETETLATYAKGPTAPAAANAGANLQAAPPLVLSTGGGIVTVPENLPLLRRIGFIVWIRRDLDAIASSVAYAKDRPLLRDRDALDALWGTRSDLYAAWADTQFENQGKITSAAERLTSRLRKLASEFKD